MTSNADHENTQSPHVTQVMGVHAFNRPARPSIRLLAAWVDLIGALALGTALIPWLLQSTQMSASACLMTSWFAMPFVLFVAARVGLSPGHKIWGIKRQQNRKFVEVSRLKGGILLRAWALSGLVCLALVFSLSRLEHAPEFAKSSNLKIASFAPTASPSLSQKSELSPEWGLMPLYYAIGAWPVRFGQTAIRVAVPYEKGPPEQFVGKIDMHWKEGEVLVQAWGPQTPPVQTALGQFRPTLTREQINHCFDSSDWTFECFDLNARSLIASEGGEF